MMASCIIGNACRDVTQVTPQNGVGGGGSECLADGGHASKRIHCVEVGIPDSYTTDSGS